MALIWSLAHGQALYLLASVVTGKQDFRWQSAIVANSANQESSGCLAAPGGNHDWALPNGPWRFYRRLASRLGKAKAVTATARKIAVLFYNVLRYGWVYQDPGADYYKERYHQRILRNLQRRAQSLGFELASIADPRQRFFRKATALLMSDSLNTSR